MSGYQLLQAQVALTFLLAAAPIVALVLVRRNVVAPLVLFGGVILFAWAVGFALGFLSAEGVMPPAGQVMIDYAKAAPSFLLVAYVCSMQARRYRTARNNDWIRTWFGWAPYILGATLLGAFVGDLIVRPPVLSGSKEIPVASAVIETPRFVVGAVFAALAAFVFLGAARAGSGPLALNQRFQNLFFGIGLAGQAGLALHALIVRGIKSSLPEELVAVRSVASTVEYVFVAMTVVIALGIFCYYAQSKPGRFLERFASFVDLVGDLAEELANAPLSKGRLNLPRTIMHHAAGEEFLGLSSGDKRRADNAFLTKAILEYRAGEGGRGAARIDRRRLLDLLRAYDQELEEPVLARGLGRERARGGFPLPDTLRDLLPGEGSGLGLGEALSAALRDEAGKPALASSSPEWEQLAYVALADGGLLPAGQREAILEGRGVSERVLGAYHLALYKVQTYREELGRSHHDLEEEGGREP